MGKFREGSSRTQQTFFPKSLDEYVGEEDSSRYVDALVEEFDLSTIESKYSTLGRRAYSPKVLVKLLLYGKLRGMSSSRELARACKENVRFMYLVQNERPDFRTISDFRKRHIKELGGLLRQTVQIGIAEGIITLSHVAIDGTKIKANASGDSFRRSAKLEEYLIRLEKSLQDDVELDKDEDDEHGGDDGEPKLPKSLRGKKDLSNRLKAALASIKDPSHDQRSMTDPDARFMKGREGKHPSYNAQAAVDADSRMVVGANVTTVGSDQNELKAVLEDIEENANQNPKQVSADRGYYATEGLVELERRGIDGVVPRQETNSNKFSQKDFIYDAEQDEYTCPAGQILTFIREKPTGVELYRSEDCTGCQLSSYCLSESKATRTLCVHPDIAVVQRMQYRLEREDAKEAMRIRAQTVELLFAWIKTHKKMRQFIFRGLSSVKELWNFELAAVNVQRLINIRKARLAAA